VYNVLIIFLKITIRFLLYFYLVFLEVQILTWKKGKRKKTLDERRQNLRKTYKKSEDTLINDSLFGKK